MTEQSTIVRSDLLEQAIQTVIHDRRIPQNLRLALAVYQSQGAESKGLGISIRPSGQTALPVLPTAVGLADVVAPYTSRSSANEDHGILDSVPAAIEHGIRVRVWHNDESLDWSVEINGQIHEHVTSEMMEALVECAVIVAETSLTRAFANRTQ